ncbi:MAG TPA: hypothetical protein VM754_03150 [Actinomycetota bacterium]|jgi:hypothetical protein|nr:hypothetical protein [Actinomycetota bacterium]
MQAAGRPLNRVVLSRAVALLLLAVLLGACDRGGNPTFSRGSKTITSADGALQFEVPNSWSSQTDLNEVAALQAADHQNEAYGVVIEDPRSAFSSMELGRFADQEMQQLVARVGLADLSGPEQVSVDGKDAVRYQLKGFHNEVEVVYLYTFVETPDRFLKVITWSLASHFDQNREVLERVAVSVRELKPLEEPTPSPDTQPDPAQIPPPQDPAGIDRGVEPDS